MTPIRTFILILFLALLSPGCIGFSVPGLDVFSRKPWTLLNSGDEFGRDQLANRYLAANKMVPMKGWTSNSVLSVLGQPSEIEILQSNVSEDWYFIYYKHYKKWPMTDEGVFMVRFYDGQVIDVVSLN